MASSVSTKFTSPAIAQQLIRQHTHQCNHSASLPPKEAETRIHFDIKALNRPSRDNRVVGVLLYSAESGREELIVYPRKLENKLTVISDDGRHILRHLPLQAVPLFGTEAQRSTLLMIRFTRPEKDWFGKHRTVNTALRTLFGDLQARLTLRNTTAGMRAAMEAVRAERDYLFNQSISRQDDLDVRVLSAAFCTSSDEHCAKMDKHQVMKAILYKCEDLGIAMLNRTAGNESTELSIMLCRYLGFQKAEEEAAERRALSLRAEHETRRNHNTFKQT